VIDGAGKAVRLQNLGSIDLRQPNSSDTLLISPDARMVQVGDWLSKRALRFDLARRAVAVDPAASGALAKPITESTSVKLTDWESGLFPKVNGATLSLEKNERSRSVALVPGTDKFFVGGDWYLRLFDSQGKQIWARPAFADVRGVNVSADGKLIVAAYLDGTVRWHRVSDGEELLALFMHPDGQRWIAWTPQGYYDASAGADELIGWQVNHGYDQAPDFFPVSQFQQRFNRRDVIARTRHAGCRQGACGREQSGRRPRRQVCPAYSIAPDAHRRD
jgi:WD40 repeat protein